MLESQRRTRIMDILSDNGAATINDLAQSLDVSAMTIRRDLDKLEARGWVKRTYGGVTLPDGVIPDPPFLQRETVQQVTKRLIGRQAAMLVEPGERLILDGGSTVAAVCPELRTKEGLTVITCSLPAIQALSGRLDLELICTGGTFDPALNAFVGPLAEQVLNNVRVDKAFLGATSLSLTDGFSNSSLANAALQRVILKVAQETYLLVDSSKFARSASWIVSRADSLTGIITDSGVPDETVERLQEAGITMFIAQETEA